MKYKYMVYRIYSDKERSPSEDKAIFYGWSNDKNVIKAFLAQRDNKKYKVVKMTNEEIVDIYAEDVDNSSSMIDYIKIKSAKTKEDVYMFMTASELREVEIHIQELFRDLCRVSDIKGNGDYLEMVINLQPLYYDALFYLGYRPPELDVIFPSASGYSDLNEVEDAIDNAYAREKNIKNPLGLSVLTDVSNKILYSLESFMMILREDM